MFSTPAMIYLMELAAKDTIAPYLADDEESVGVNVHVEHLAATPVLAGVRMEAEVTGITGRLIDFRVAAFDEVPPGALGLLVDSYGLVSVVAARASAAEQAAIAAGDEVVLSPREGGDAGSGAVVVEMGVEIGVRSAREEH